MPWSCLVHTFLLAVWHVVIGILLLLLSVMLMLMALLLSIVFIIVVRITPFLRWLMLRMLTPFLSSVICICTIVIIVSLSLIVLLFTLHLS